MSMDDPTTTAPAATPRLAQPHSTALPARRGGLAKVFRLLGGAPAAWLIAGLAVGYAAHAWQSDAEFVLPLPPAHAVATDRYENFAIATGPLDSDVEAVFVLDFLTGDLKAAVLSAQLARFNAFYEKNILEDMGIDPARNPRYLMVTGVANLRRGLGNQARPGMSVVYIAELTSGKIAAYGVPWTPQLHNAGVPFHGTLIPLDITQFRTAVVRDQ